MALLSGDRRWTFVYDGVYRGHANTQRQRIGRGRITARGSLLLFRADILLFISPVTQVCSIFSNASNSVSSAPCDLNQSQHHQFVASVRRMMRRSNCRARVNSLLLVSREIGRRCFTKYVVSFLRPTASFYLLL